MDCAVLPTAFTPAAGKPGPVSRTERLVPPGQAAEELTLNALVSAPFGVEVVRLPTTAAFAAPAARTLTVPAATRVAIPAAAERRSLCWNTVLLSLRSCRP